MTDRELLKLAAKAAGIELLWTCGGIPVDTPTVFKGLGSDETWNPLTNDGDALRLAVACGLIVDCSRPSAGEPYKQHAIWLDDAMSNAELTRRAIVRAAAEIGRQMP